MPEPTALLQGTLDLLILKAISLGPLHGYAVLLRLQQISQDRLRIQQGSLYPPCTGSSTRASSCPNGASPRTGDGPGTYRLTAAGRRRLKEETGYWERLSGAISMVLAAGPRTSEVMCRAAVVLAMAAARRFGSRASDAISRW